MIKIAVKILNELSSPVNKPEKMLKEGVDTSSDDIMVYMNTWKNYNEYGADLEMYGIKDGWMTPEEGLEFCEKYAEDEPFINDVDNCPIEVSEYDNAPDKLEELIRYNEFEDKTLLKNAMETGKYSTVDDYIDVLESGDYIWFPGVSDDEGLGEAYVDMVGFEGITSPENYIDRQKVIDMIESTYSEEELEEYGGAEEEADVMIDSYTKDGNKDFFEEYFSYEALGRELSVDYTYTSDGAIDLF